MNIEIKDMETPDEIRGKGRVHWQSWRVTYAGLLNENYLAGRTEEKCVETAFLYPNNTLVAKDGDRVVGFAAYGACRDGDLPGAGEVFALYVLREYQGRGVGRALMEAALAKIAEYATVALWVLAGNEQAAGFYRHMGFTDDIESTYTLGSPRTVRRMLLRR